MKLSICDRYFYPVFNYYYNNNDGIYVGPLKTETQQEQKSFMRISFVNQCSAKT